MAPGQQLLHFLRFLSFTLMELAFEGGRDRVRVSLVKCIEDFSPLGVSGSADVHQQVEPGNVTRCVDPGVTRFYQCIYPLCVRGSPLETARSDRGSMGKT